MPSKEDLNIEAAGDRRDSNYEAVWREGDWRGAASFVAEEQPSSTNGVPANSSINVPNILAGVVLGLVLAEGSHWWFKKKSNAEELSDELSDELFERV